MGTLEIKGRIICTADAETDPFSHGAVIKPFLWGFYDGTEYVEFAETRDFIAHVSKIRCIVYAHNGGKFDWHFISNHLPFGSDLRIINGRLAQFTIGEAEFRDSWNILPLPLGAMEKTKIDYAIFTRELRDKPENKKLISNYLQDDCRFLHKFVAGFIDKHGCRLTQATASLKLWEGMTGRKAPVDKHGDIYRQLSSFYYGGRCQAFKTGEIAGPLQMVDINSAYPRAMMDAHPIGLDYYDIDKTATVRPDHFVECRGPSCGALPYRADDGSLWFPDDGIDRYFTITGHEWLAMADTVGIAGYRILRIVECGELTDFADYIGTLWEERQEAKATGDKINDILCKLAMNSLYGKFASNPDNYEKYMVADPASLLPDSEKRGRRAKGIYNFAGYFGDLPLLSAPLDDEEKIFYNVGTSASITGWVRAYLWRAICQCEGVVYCDTDSIVAASCAGIDMGDELGQWKREYYFTDGAVGGKKLYAFKKDTSKTDAKDIETKGAYKLASKGVKISAEEIYTIAKGGEVVYKPIAPTFSVNKAPHYQSRKIKKLEKTIDSVKKRV